MNVDAMAYTSVRAAGGRAGVAGGADPGVGGMVRSRIAGYDATFAALRMASTSAFFALIHSTRYIICRPTSENHASQAKPIMAERIRQASNCEHHVRSPHIVYTERQDAVRAEVEWTYTRVARADDPEER